MTTTNDEAASAAAAPVRKEDDVYDRQIRLWGAESQAKMAKAKVLYIHVTGVSSEILKNLVLAGIRAVICDNRPYPDAVLETPSLFLPAAPAEKKLKYETVAHAVRPVIEELNPLLGDCEIITDKDPSELVKDDKNDHDNAAFFSQFAIVVASQIGLDAATRLSKAVTATGGKFYMVDTFGMLGASVLDLGADHEYRKEYGKELRDPTPLEAHVPLETVFQVPLQDAVNRFHKNAPPPEWIKYRCLLEYVHQQEQKNGKKGAAAWPSKETADEFCTAIQKWIQETSPDLKTHEVLTDPSELQKLAGTATAQIAPVCAVLGGVIGNEIIKAISGKGKPANNTVLLDGWTGKCLTFLVQPKK